jgi:hypothetical protein
MNEWKVVPAEPPEAILDVLYNNGLDEQDETLSAIYRAMLAAAPTPPFVLPPLPESVENKMRDFAVACARGGHEERVDSANALRREIRSYARAALAQYGIKE